jgi:hypothetical protein
LIRQQLFSDLGDLADQEPECGCGGGDCHCRRCWMRKGSRSACRIRICEPYPYPSSLEMCMLHLCTLLYSFGKTSVWSRCVGEIETRKLGGNGNGRNGKLVAIYNDNDVVGGLFGPPI